MEDVNEPTAAASESDNLSTMLAQARLPNRRIVRCFMAVAGCKLWGLKGGLSGYLQFAARNQIVQSLSHGSRNRTRLLGFQRIMLADMQ